MGAGFGWENKARSRGVKFLLNTFLLRTLEDRGYLITKKEKGLLGPTVQVARFSVLNQNLPD